MIYRSYDEVPYSACRFATIMPGNPGRFGGVLELGGKEYPVEIVHIGGESGPRYVKARVVLFEPHFEGYGRKDRFAELVARRPLTDDKRWRNVKVDLRDGRAAYVRRWAYYFPDDKDMDVFLAEAAGFIVGFKHDFFSMMMHSSEFENLVAFDDDLDTVF